MTSGAITLSQPEKNRALALLVAGHGTGHWYIGMLSVLYPVLTVTFHLTYSQVGLFESSRGIVAVVASLAGGYLADTFDRRHLALSLTLVSLAVFTAALGFANTFVVAWLWLTLGGIGNSLWHPYAMTLLSSVFPRRKGMALSLHDAGANIFHGLAPMVVGVMLGVWNWRFVTQIHVWPGIVMGGLILIALPVVKSSHFERRQRLDYRQTLGSGILRNRQFLLASGISICLTMGRMGLLTFLPLFLAFELDLNSATQGLYMGVLTFSGALLAPGIGTLSDRIGLRRVLLVAVLIASTVTIALVFAQPGLLLLAIIAVVGGALFSVRSLILVYVISVTPEEIGGSSVGTIFSVNRLFGILSPIIAGIIADAFGLRGVFYFIGGIIFIGLLLILGMRAKTRGADVRN